MVTVSFELLLLLLFLLFGLLLDDELFPLEDDLDWPLLDDWLFPLLDDWSFRLLELDWPVWLESPLLMTMIPLSELELLSLRRRI